MIEITRNHSHLGGNIPTSVYCEIVYEYLNFGSF